MATKRYSVHRCLLCGHTAIDQTTRGRWVKTSCPACQAVLKIEFAPPDAPHLSARIERLAEPEDDEPRRLPTTESDPGVRPDRAAHIPNKRASRAGRQRVEGRLRVVVRNRKVVDDDWVM